MIPLLLRVLRLLPFLFAGHRQLALENLALHQQLAVYKRRVTRPRLRRIDRLFWVGLARIWAGWRQPLVIVTPDTVLRWQRRRFREYWTKLSGRPTGGRPPVNAEIKALVARMAAANPLWGAPRIHGELLKLGIDMAERTVSRLLPKRRSSPSRLGERSSPTISGTWSPSISSRCLPSACASSSFSSCSRTIAGASSTSTSPSTPPPTGPPSRSSTPSRTTLRRPISCATVTRSTASSFGTA